MAQLNVFTYTIKFREHEQDNLNIIPIQPGERDQMPRHLDYDEVLQKSLEEGHISKEEDIQALQDGSHHYEPLFESRPAQEVAQSIIEDDCGVPFHPEETEHEIFYDGDLREAAYRAVLEITPEDGVEDPISYAEKLWDNRTQGEEYRDARANVTLDDYIAWIKEKVHQSENSKL